MSGESVETELAWRRAVMWSALAMALVVVISTALQLRPFNFSTVEVEQSVGDFDRNRQLRMFGGMLRTSLIYAALPFSIGLTRVFPRTASTLTAAALLTGAALWVVAGVVSVVMGVPAEEYGGGLRDEAVLFVLADAMFWIQDNVALVGTMVMALGVATFSWQWRSARRLPGLAVALGLGMLPAAGAASLAFFVPGETRLEHLWYFTALMAAAVVFVVWLTGVATLARPRNSTKFK